MNQKLWGADPRSVKNRQDPCYKPLAERAVVREIAYSLGLGVRCVT